ncbi:ATPase [uncultured Microbacterium sp.]|uniref:ATPase n=1 Tax=uncultured Microbacterium sp. TaxID=191216 RepID=UPI00262D5878|nr:ATPase [uncultured Microbacterium sp.]
MQRFAWFVLGIAGGFVAAHLVNKDPRGHEVLADVDARISEFTDRIGDAYRAQEAKIDGLVADVKDVAAGAIDSAQSVAADAKDAVDDTVAAATDAVRDTAAKLTD